MKFSFTSIAFLFCFSLFARVGIGTTTPNTKSMLDVSSTSDGGTSYRGLMPPRVPTILNRNSIAPGSTDKGLTIFLEETNCLQIWNGTAWENIHCLNSVAFTGVVQNFDLGNTWGYVSDIPFFDNGTDGFYGITDASNSIFSNLTTLTNQFLGIRDLDDEGDNGTNGLATITFNSIDVSSALGGVTVSFDYQFFRLDTGDNAFYTLVIDGTPQATIQFINPGMADQSASGTISVPVSGGTSTVQLILAFDQNGDTDVFGFDNFVISPN